MIRRLLCMLAVVWPWATFAVSPTVHTLEGMDGLHALVVERHELPILTMRIVFRDSGALADAPGKAGVAPLLAALLKEGAGDLSAVAFKRQLEKNGIELSMSSDADHIQIDLRTLARHRETAMRLLNLALTAPRLDAEAITRVKEELRSRQKELESMPAALAERAWMAAAFPGHPYGQPPYGTPESLKAITAADLREAVRTRLVGSRALVAIVGDITPEDAAALLNRWLILPQGSPAAVAAPLPPKEPGKTLRVIRDLPQSVIAFGAPGIARSDQDYFAAYLLSHILGNGDFSSRLMQELREQRGIAYSVHTQLQEFSQTALFGGGLATRPEKAEEAIAVIQSVMRGLRKNGVSEQELTLAKRTLTGSFALQLDSASEMVGYLIAMQLYHLGGDYLQKRNQLIDAVTPKDIERVSKRLLRTDQQLWVIAGPAEAKKAKE